MASISMIFCADYPSHSATFRHSKTFTVPKFLILHLRSSSSSKLSFFPSLLSSNAENRQPQEENEQAKCDAITFFLIKECGFSDSQLPKIMKRSAKLFRTISTERAQNAVELFRGSGFTPQQVRKIILENPNVLKLKVDGLLKAKIEFLKTLGFNGQEMGYIISKQPRILNMSLEQNLGPKITLLLKLFGSKPNLYKAIKRAPGLLVCNNRGLRAVSVSGNPKSKLISTSLNKVPALLTYTAENLEKKLSYMASIGLMEVIVKRAPVLLGLSSQNLESKLKHLASIGLLEDEITELVKKAPNVLALSMDKMKNNMDFLTHTARFSPSIVVRYPELLRYSVEKRMKPRIRVFEYLIGLQHSQCLTIGLESMLCLSEQKFARKFLRDCPQAAELYKYDSSKSDDVQVMEVNNKELNSKSELLRFDLQLVEALILPIIHPDESVK